TKRECFAPTVPPSCILPVMPNPMSIECEWEPLWLQRCPLPRHHSMPLPPVLQSGILTILSSIRIGKR
ncbi:hypothetical protein HDU91_001526, partial [Kappamyces sp. JEL0680]